MKKEIFNIIGFSADPIINAALKSLITAIKCKPIIINDYEEMLEKIEKEDINAILVDEYVIHKGQRVHIKKVFKNYKHKIPIICVLENLMDMQEFHPFKQYFQKPINANTLKNYLSPYFGSKHVGKVNPLIRIGNFDFDKNLNTLVDEKNNIINLTNLESKLLLTFFKNVNKTLNEKFLLKNVWGYSSHVNSNTIKTHIWRLRKKISKEHNTSFDLETANNGYVLKLR
jgi:DNA-binding response OmpR family regulator